MPPARQTLNHVHTSSQYDWLRTCCNAVYVQQSDGLTARSPGSAGNDRDTCMDRAPKPLTSSTYGTQEGERQRAMFISSSIVLNKLPAARTSRARRLWCNDQNEERKDARNRNCPSRDIYAGNGSKKRAICMRRRHVHKLFHACARSRAHRGRLPTKRTSQHRSTECFALRDRINAAHFQLLAGN
jgi:hypothetical protein